MSESSKSISLQKKLVQSSMFSSIIAGVIAFLILVSVSVYQTMQMQDEIMEEISDLLLFSDISAHSGNQLDELSEEFDIQYQLLLFRQLLNETEGFNTLSTGTEFVVLNWDHFAIVWTGKHLLRRYVETDGQLSLRMYQPLSIRFKELTTFSLAAFATLVVLWLLQWGIVHYSIRRRFKAIHQLSSDIAEKYADDLSPIKQSQPELIELQPMVMQLNQMLKRLELSLLAEQRFTADASHELRSPLSAIQMRLQVLNRKYGELDPHLKNGFQQILTDVQRGTLILENLLLLARLDPSNTLDLPKNTVEMHILIHDVIKMLEPFSAEKQITFQLNLVKSSISANQELLFSCIRNLLDNAIRYSEVEKEIYISLRQEAHHIYLYIENVGQGVDKEVLNRLGDRFYRELGTKTQGSGLGLSICKKIVELHRGNMTFTESSYGGLKVTLRLPI